MKKQTLAVNLRMCELTLEACKYNLDPDVVKESIDISLKNGKFRPTEPYFYTYCIL